MLDNKTTPDDFHDFIRWLEDHNYCKVVPCSRCYFWGHALDPEMARVKRCRNHQTDTYHDDYCSDALERKKED